jgi:hypothetical protein
VLAEMLVGIGVAAMLFLAVTTFAMFCSRSFAALYNYVDLDDVNRVAIDRITRDVRQANRVSYFNSNGRSLTLEDGDAARTAISYVYDPTSRTLTRTRGTETSVILKECDSLAFWIGQRNTVLGGYDVFPVAMTLDTAKVINVKWVCSRSLFGQKENTESVQTARIVIRKQSR